MRAFAYFEGVPRQILYDNTKLAVVMTMTATSMTAGTATMMSMTAMATPTMITMQTVTWVVVKSWSW